MARIRSIKPEFFRHKRLFSLERETGFPIRVAFAGLWCCADREGRFRWDADDLGLQCLPWDDVDFRAVLDALRTRGFVVAYTVEGVDYGVIPGFKRHQIINNKERASLLPAPPDGLIEQGELLGYSTKQANASRTRQSRVVDASSTRQRRVAEDVDPETGEITSRDQNGPDFEESATGSTDDDDASGTRAQRVATRGADTLLEGKGKEGKGKEKEGNVASLAREIIAAFDDERAKAWGEAQRRPWPHPNDLGNATAWASAGATPELCRSVFAPIMAKKRGYNHEPPDSLNYFTKPIANAINGAHAPMPEPDRPRGNGNGATSTVHQPSREDVREDMKRKAKMIGEGQYFSRITADDVRAMIRQGWLTPEAAERSGYAL